MSACLGDIYNGAHIVLSQVCNWAPSDFCLDTYRKGPPQQADRKEFPDTRESYSLSPKFPIGLAKAMFWGAASPCVADQTI